MGTATDVVPPDSTPATAAIVVSLTLHPEHWDELETTGAVTVAGLVEPDTLRGVPRPADVTIYAAPSPSP